MLQLTIIQLMKLVPGQKMATAPVFQPASKRGNIFELAIPFKFRLEIARLVLIDFQRMPLRETNPDLVAYPLLNLQTLWQVFIVNIGLTHQLIDPLNFQICQG